MSMDDYERAVSLIQESEDEADFEGPKSPELIELAERAVGLTFPPTYHRFLSEHGAGNFGSTEIYGVINEDFENSGIPDAVWYNLTLRRAGHDDHLFAFYAAGDGEDFCLDAARTDSNGELPVVAITPGDNRHEEIAKDFGSALLMLVRQELGLDEGG